MTDSILYIGTVVTEGIETDYNMAYYSRAADNKKRGVISSLQNADVDVTVLSPIFVNNNTFRYHAARTIHDEDLGVDILIPPIVDIYGLNYVFLGLVTVLYTVRMALRGDYSATLFYNIQLQTAVPALFARLFCLSPIILEYEDALFLHDNRGIRWTAKALRPVINSFLDGAVCVNEPLENLLETDNTAIVRGFPSIGMPSELPEPEFQRDETVVMFAGRFDDVRGIDTFLNVAPRVEYDRNEIRFWISGYGPAHECIRVENHIADLEDDRFSYFATLPWEEYRKRIVSADILINFQDPSHDISEYTFPSKLLDFMSAESVIVSTDMSDLRTYFDDKMMIAGTTDSELLNSLDETIKEFETDAIHETSRRAREWVESECSRNQVGNSIMSVVRAAG